MDKGFSITSDREIHQNIKDAITMLLVYIDCNYSFNLEEKHINVDLYTNSDAVQKGRSLMLPMFLSIMSALTDTPLRCNAAATGVVTMHGTVLPVGGIKAKVTAARQVGCEIILLPQPNATECTDDQVKGVGNVEDALSILLPQALAYRKDNKGNAKI